MTRLLRSLLVAVGVGISPALLSAQPVVVDIPPGTRPRTVPTTASVVTGGAFAVVPAAPALTQTSQQANPCNPGACFAGSITVQANTRWQAQVRVKPAAPSTFYVNWIIPPANTTPARLSTAWYTIRTSTTASTGAPTSLLFNANKTTGQGGQTPTAAQLSGYIEFRVIALP